MRHRPTVHLRPATLADIPMLQHWDQQPHVQAATGADGDEGWEWETEVPRQVAWRELLVAEVGGTPIGMVQIIDPAEEETHYWGAVAPHQRALDIWIGEANYLGRGYGTQMMQQALARCWAHPQVTAVLIDPLVTNTDAIRFYERLGFRKVEQRQFDEDLCWVMRLPRPTGA